MTWQSLPIENQLAQTHRQIGVDLGLVRPAVYAALVAAGLLSVVLFPLTALTILKR